VFALPAGLFDLNEDAGGVGKGYEHVPFGCAFSGWLPLDDAQAPPREMKGTSGLGETSIAVLWRLYFLDDSQECLETALTLQEGEYLLNIIGPHLPGGKPVSALPPSIGEESPC
jgi:hypothetical protein